MTAIILFDETGPRGGLTLPRPLPGRNRAAPRDRHDQSRAAGGVEGDVDQGRKMPWRANRSQTPAGWPAEASGGTPPPSRRDSRRDGTLPVQPLPPGSRSGPGGPFSDG